MGTKYRVGGMTCDGCARSVTNAIKRKAPDAKVTVDLKAGTVAVEGEADPASIAQAIGDAGYNFGGPAT